jgi:hypothetical protein
MRERNKIFFDFYRAINFLCITNEEIENNKILTLCITCFRKTMRFSNKNKILIVVLYFQQS